MSKTSELHDQVKDWRAALAERVAENETILASFSGDKEAGIDVVVTDDGAAKFRENLAQIKALREMVEGAEATLDGKAFLDAPAGRSIAGAAAAAGAEPTFGGKTVGQMFVESDEFKALQGGKAGLTMRTPFTLKVGDLAGQRKDVYSDLPTGTPGALGGLQRDPIVGRAHRTVRVRDLFQPVSTTNQVIEYFRITGFTNAASVVPERSGGAFGAKPQSSMTIVGEQATVRTIAHWEAAHRNVLADEPQLRSVIDSELLYGLALTEDDQILNGTGTGEDLEGILNVSGIGTFSWSAGETLPVPDTRADAIRRAATQAMLSYYEPNGVVLHDSDWEKVELTKNADGDYLLAVSIALGGEPRVWRMPVVATQAIAEGTALVGNFGVGATLYDREEATIRVAEQHSDFFIRNAVVILAEERLALATKRPEAFVAVTFDAAPS